VANKYPAPVMRAWLPISLLGTFVGLYIFISLLKLLCRNAWNLAIHHIWIYSAIGNELPSKNYNYNWCLSLSTPGNDLNSIAFSTDAWLCGISVLQRDSTLIDDWHNLVLKQKSSTGGTSWVCHWRLPYFNVFCDLSLNRRMATWNLYNKETQKNASVLQNIMDKNQSNCWNN